MANKEAVEFALTALIEWLEENGQPEMGGTVYRRGQEYQFNLFNVTKLEEAEDAGQDKPTEVTDL